MVPITFTRCRSENLDLKNELQTDEWILDQMTKVTNIEFFTIIASNGNGSTNAMADPKSNPTKIP